MKTCFAASAALVALAGCATGPQGPYNGSAPRDPSQWRVVSVTPVPAGTAARIAAALPDGKPVELSSRPVASMPRAYVPAPLYAPSPLYTPPYIQQPSYYWPPITLSLGFVFGRHWSRGHHRGYRHH